MVTHGQDRSKPGTNGTPRIVAAYNYPDETGALLYQVLRYEPGFDGEKKTFRQRRPDGLGDWIWNLQDTRRVLYRLPELLSAPPDRPVFVVEGEKDADNLHALELLVTTCAMGAGKWRPEYSEQLRGRHVLILPDNDHPGLKHADEVARSLESTAASVKVLKLPNLPHKGDVSDWLAAGGTKEELLTLALRGDAWEPPPEDRRGDDQELPPRDDYACNPEPWEPPIPLPGVPCAEPFPVEVLPSCLIAFVKDAAAALACPTDYVAVPLLAIAGAAIGASRAIEIKPGWRERPCLYAAVVGPPGSAKTPALKLAASPVYTEQTRRRRIFDREKNAFEESDDNHTSKLKLSTVYVSDITTEALAGVLLENPRGVALIRDELTAWVAGMDQYRAKGRGSDRQLFLAAWAGEPVSVHRKNQADGPVFVPHPFIGIVGGLPPDLLPRFRGEKQISDGFFDRILFSYPEPAPAVGETWLCVSGEAVAAWSETLSFLWGLQQEPDPDGGERPRFVRLDATGRKVWERFTHDLAAQMNREAFPDCLRGPWSKMRGYCARLALVLHFLRLAGDETKSEDVDGESLGRAVELVQYFQSHTRKVYATIEADRDIEKAKRLLEWILRERRMEFKRWEPYEDVKNQSEFPSVDALEAPLSRLAKHNLIRLKQLPERKGPGRSPAPVYEVNPHLIRHPVNPVNPENSPAETNLQDLQDSPDGFR